MSAQPSYKLLFIEDDYQLAAYMSEALSDKGYEVISAENGKLGMKMLTQHSPDLIITDIVMPEKEGVEIIMELRQNGSTLPIIAISGGNFGNAGSYLDIAKKLGANAILTKPFEMDELILEIEKLLN